MEINQNMMVSDFLRKDPNLAKIFINFGLAYLVCEEPFWDTVKEFAEKHKVKNNESLKETNKNIEKTHEKI